MTWFPANEVLERAEDVRVASPGAEQNSRGVSEIQGLGGKFERGEDPPELT
jgi:hypothetical protein